MINWTREIRGLSRTPPVSGLHSSGDNETIHRSRELGLGVESLVKLWLVGSQVSVRPSGGVVKSSLIYGLLQKRFPQEIYI